MHEEMRYGIQELAQLGGVSRRTVRYYVRLGLLPAPTGTGRGKHYTQEHLDALIRVRDLQESGVSLNAIAEQFEAAGPEGDSARGPASLPGSSATAAVVEQSSWVRVVLSEGVELHLEGRSVERERLVRLRKAVLEILNKGGAHDA
ncbi:MAG: MerR family transcriptional regulator [Myxococcota bacterium]